MSTTATKISMTTTKNNNPPIAPQQHETPSAASTVATRPYQNPTIDEIQWMKDNEKQNKIIYPTFLD
jgi:hypothetical protein